MNLYEIKASLYELLENGFNAECVDPETGEFDADKAADLLEKAKEDFADKVDGTALYIEELDARCEALRAKEQALAARRKAYEKRAEWLRGYLSGALDKPYESDAVKITFRKSVSVVVDNEQLLPDAYVTVSEVRKPDKAALKTALAGGAVISGARLEEKRNIQIK